MTGFINWKVVRPLYLGGICWASGHDTLYDYQDRRGDAKAGAKYTPLILGSKPAPLMYVLAAGFVNFLVIAGIQNRHRPLYVFTVGSAAVHVYWKISTSDASRPSDRWAKFYSNSWIGWPMRIGLFDEYASRMIL